MNSSSSEAPELPPSYAPEDLVIAEANVLQSEVERSRLRTEMSGRLSNMQGSISLGEYWQTCAAVAQTKESHLLTVKGQTEELYKFFGVEVLPRIFPNVESRHIAAKGNKLELVGSAGLEGIPELVGGVQTSEIIGRIANGLLVDKTTGKIVAEGNCTATSLAGIKQVVAAHPSLGETVRAVRIQPAYRHTIPDEPRYPKLRPLSDGHTIIAVDCKSPDGADAKLLIDPTVAQVDRTDQYDIEVTMVPGTQWKDYLRLRYSTTPDAEVF